MTRVKICGFTEPHHVSMAAEAGADFIGFIFAPSRRQVSVEKVQQMVKITNGLKSKPATVGVFVNATIDEVNHIADHCHLDWVQLSGDETWDYCMHIEKPIIKTVHITTSRESSEYLPPFKNPAPPSPSKERGARGERLGTNQTLLNQIIAGYHMLNSHEFICLIDSKVKDRYGGTGQKYDWRLVSDITDKFPVFIAGGLTPNNVGTLIEKIHPWGVDVSTGVESNGQKDETKIRTFIEAVRKSEITSN
jgi:phosphoribosylanthranilate isomerase